MATIDDLKQAFAGESQANRKYTAFAKKADKDGLPGVARLFRAAAEAETIHALGHFSAMGGVCSTAENIQAAFEGETFEYTEMYPPMLEEAEKEDHAGKRMFALALKAEEVHAGLYKKAQEAVDAGKDLQTDEIHLCIYCGNLVLAKPTGPCELCGAKPETFVPVS